MHCRMPGRPWHPMREGPSRPPALGPFSLRGWQNKEAPIVAALLYLLGVKRGLLVPSFALSIP
jgi:hypothetical protein